MRGLRVKTLRREFREKHGRPPAGSVIRRVGPACYPLTGRAGLGRLSEARLGKNVKPWTEQVKIAASRWITKWIRHVDAEGQPDGKPATMLRTVGEMFMRKLFGIEVAAPSEWRAVKKAWVRRHQ